MKKIIFAFVALLFLMNAVEAQNSFGISAGATFSKISAKMEGLTVTSKTHTGYTAGIVANVAIGKDFSFRPELNYVQKGGDLSFDSEDYNITFNYLELPLNILYNKESTIGKFFVGAGPTFAYALSGKSKEEGENIKLELGNGDNADYKRLDGGVNATVGFDFKGGFFLAANYYLGLMNISPDSEEKDHIHNFGIKLGYMFSSAKKMKQ